MRDFVGSVAQQDVSVTTDVVTSAVVGDNFYKLLYITSAALESGLYVTKDTYESVIDAVDTSILDASAKEFMKNNLASFFEYGSDVDAYIIPASLYSKWKYRAYATYIEPSYVADDSSGTTEYKPSDAMLAILNGITPDSEFSALVTDVAVPSDLAKAETTSGLDGVVKPILTALNEVAELYTFARGSTDELVLGGLSPALYQLGRTLGLENDTGTPVGNNFDMVACDQANVLPTLDTDTSDMTAVGAAVAAWFEDNNVCYFKPVGNSTGQVTNFGATSLRGSIFGVNWLTAYCNYVVRVNAAQLITVMNTYRDSKLYRDILASMDSTVGAFVSLGRIELYQNTAPSWEQAKELGNGSTIIIPKAWQGWYVDNVRRVKISGTLYVNA